MLSTRSIFPVQLTVQLDNPVQQAQWGAPVVLTTVTVVTSAEGQQLYQPAHHVQPAVADDITDDVLAALQAKLAAVGLEVTRKQ